MTGEGYSDQRDAARTVAETAAYYDLIAPRYDEAAQGAAWPVNGWLEAELAYRMPTVHSALDLGSGTGQTVDTIRSTCAPERIVAVDASSRMLAVLAAKYGEEEITAVQSSIAEYLRGPQEQFDLVTAIGVLEFEPELPQLWSEVAARLNPGGLLVFTYEPLIDGDPLQQEPVTVFRPLKSNPEVCFTTYRWQRSGLAAGLERSGLLVVGEQYSPGYQRGPHMVRYGFVVAQKP